MNENTFTATFGLVPGYFVSQQPDADIRAFAILWQEAMQAELKQSGITVSVVLHETRTVYPVSYGCAPGGDTTITVGGIFNAAYYMLEPGLLNDKLARWREAVLRVITYVKQALHQETVTVVFSDSHVHYMKA